jgi:hypothetical protein
MFRVRQTLAVLKLLTSTEIFSAGWISISRWMWSDSPPNSIKVVVILEMLSYHVALVKGTDVDKPRNLAKSVTQT